jgi:group I intron endonuclease
MGCIYILKNKINGKCYVGQTVNIKHRFCEHKCKGKSKINRPLNNAIRKYEWANFAKYIYKNIPISYLDYFEIELIKRLNSISPHGYNLALGGNKNKKVSNITRDKLSQAHRNYYKTHKHPCLGKKMSNETKLKISKANKGKTSYWKDKKMPIEMIEKAKLKRRKYIGKDNPNYGNHWTDEMKQSLSKKKKGKKQNISKESRKRKSEYMTKRNTGNHYNQNTLKKMSDSAKKTYLNGRINPMLGKHRISPSSIKIICIETGIIYESIRSAAIDLGTLNDAAIRNCLKDNSKLYKNYHFKYYKEIT